jgi:hypothetical protein
MFRVGQNLKAITFVQNYITDGKIYSISKVSQNAVYFIGDNGEQLNVYIDSIHSLFSIEREPPKTEIEWLDRVKENFKYG